MTSSNYSGWIIDPLFGKLKVKESKDSHNKEINLQGHYCQKPFTHFETDPFGNVALCCPTYLPYKIGNILEQSIDEVWNSKKAKTIRRSILNGQFNYCDKKLCPMIQSNNLPTLDSVNKYQWRNKNKKVPPYIPAGPMGAYTKEELKAITVVQEEGIDKVTEKDLETPLPTYINFCEDMSCNLKCPSCRVEKILHTRGVVYNKAKQINDKIVKAFLTEPTDRKFLINVTGSGDPFASKIYRDMLYNLDGSKFPNLIVNLQTNGVLFTPKMWNKLHKIHNNLYQCEVSFDAGTKETYEQKTRLGGDWDLLLSNCDFLYAKNLKLKKFYLKFIFVVQESNYKEMIMFAELILNRYKKININYVMLADWSTWDKKEFEHNAIWKTTHPDHKQFLNLLKDPIFDVETVNLRNLTEVRRIALNG